MAVIDAAKVEAAEGGGSANANGGLLQCRRHAFHWIRNESCKQNTIFMRELKLNNNIPPNA